MKSICQAHKQRFYPEDIGYFISPYQETSNVEAPLVSNFGNGIPTFVVVSFREILTKELNHHEDCSVIYVMDEGNKCASLMRSDCTLETLLSENNNYTANFPSSPSIKTPDLDLARSNEAFLDTKESNNATSIIPKQVRKFFRNFGHTFWRIKSRAEPSSPYISIHDSGGYSIDSLSVTKKLHDVQKNSTQDLLSKDPAAPITTPDPFTVTEKDTTCVIEPQSFFYVFWLCIVTIAYLYNCWVIPLRITFPYQTPENTPMWVILDYSMDFLYLLDVIFVKPRLMYLEDGFWVRDSKLTSKNYFQKIQFKMDVLSLLPLDLLYFKYGEYHPIFRAPRLLKIQTFWEFFNNLDNVLASPYVVRVARTLTYMVYLVHLNTCAYYAVSVYEGMGSNKWVYDGQGNAYLRCFYRATKTATSIGKNPKPDNDIEYLFMTYSWLMGVFVFAILIGQIRDIIATASKSHTEYRKLKDETLDYLRRLNVTPRIRERVEQWFSFTWEQQHTLDESRILDTLPQKLKTDVAIKVHIRTLSKVQLFHDCDEALLRDLVLKLRPVLYLPGDYICHKGEVGKEMYIVKTGQVQVVTSKGEHEVVLATLTEGSVFGEISLLNLAGTNRRTADVRSHGFSSLFVLSKNDLNEAIRYYPNAQKILKKKARQNATREGRDMPKEVMYDSNGSSSPSTRNIDTFIWNPTTRQITADRHRNTMYRNKYSSMKRYSDSQIMHFIRRKKRKSKVRLRGVLAEKINKEYEI
ncbi:cyclic nucleotide-gated cation channel beta-3 isoform X2 [Planococcus citri]|uniref:cyclic nucleotide-gated cation channel beta-3 isoform X2 n=1 Tax=Planococcus citri TaxID=170843 RepID=UPI0031F9F0FB